MRMRAGTATDALVRRSIETRERRRGFTIVRSPENSHYWFANCLLLDAEPAPTSYDAWLDACAKCFASVEIERLVVVWEVPDCDGLAPYAGSLLRECATVFVTHETPPSAAPFETREFVATSDWSAALELFTQELLADGSSEQANFEAWRFRVYRRDVAAGRSRFWGIWLDGRLAAYTGLYFEAAWARFVTPVTHAAYRRRGLFRTLAASGIHSVLATHPNATIVIAAERGSYAATIYERMGFRAVGEQHALIAPLDRGERARSSSCVTGGKT